VFTVNISTAAIAAEREVTISYSYRALVQRSGHVFNLDIAWPTKDLKVQFWHGDCGIRHVNVSDYIASARPARVTQTPAKEPSPSVEIGFDGWIFPKARVAFVWVLEDELAGATRIKPSRRSTETSRA
jgi:hypothetical protein